MAKKINLEMTSVENSQSHRWGLPERSLPIKQNNSK